MSPKRSWWLPEYESEAFWSGLFEELNERGVFGVQLAISDDHTGIQKVAEAAFLGAHLGRCASLLYSSRLERYPQETPKGGFREVKTSIWE